MKNRFLLGIALTLAIPAFAWAADRYVNGTAIPLNKTLVYTTGSQAITAGAVTATSLNVSGASTFTGAVTLSAPSLASVGAAVGAAGTTGGSCTPLTASYNTVTGTALQGVCLLTAVAGRRQIVYNDSAVSLIVYPLDAGDDTLAVDDLAALSADVGFAIGPLSTLDCEAYTTTKWHCLYKEGARSTVAAAGTGQTTCTQLASATIGSSVAVTAADATKAVCLPSGGTSSTYIPACVTLQSTVNTNTAYLPVFGAAGDSDTINGGSANAAYTMGAGARVKFCTIDGVAWLTR